MGNIFLRLSKITAKNLLELAESERLTTFMELVKIGGVEEAFSKFGAYTIFIPSEAAFYCTSFSFIFEKFNSFNVRSFRTIDSATRRSFARYAFEPRESPGGYPLPRYAGQVAHQQNQRQRGISFCLLPIHLFDRSASLLVRLQKSRT